MKDNLKGCDAASVSAFYPFLEPSRLLQISARNPTAIPSPTNPLLDPMFLLFCALYLGFSIYLWLRHDNIFIRNPGSCAQQ